MSAPKKSEMKIKCPHCGNKFAPGEALEHELQARVEIELEKKFESQSKAMEQRIRKQQEEKFQERLAIMDEERQGKETRLAELERRAVLVEERALQLSTKEQTLELELRQRMVSQEKKIREEAEKTAMAKAELESKEKQLAFERQQETRELGMKKFAQEQAEKAREEERMKAAELQKKLDDQTVLINTMKRKAEQGSMQAQGEVQELAIEDYLQATFTHDRVEEIIKGKRGGDCVHHVIDGLGNLCGKVLYESKRTKAFGGDWTQKLRDDMRLTSADIGVIVTDVLPNGMTRFGMYDGIWVCTFAEFRALAFLFRDSLIRISQVRVANEHRGDKMQMLYDYLTGNEFRQRFEAIVEGFNGLQEELAKEKKQTIARWARQEKQLFKVIENTISLHGEVRGIAGAGVKEIEALDVDEIKVLAE